MKGNNTEITVSRVIFKMNLFPGCVHEYGKRHNEIWQELKDLLKSKGIHNYSISLDEETNTLFGFMELEDKSLLNTLPQEPVMQKWWNYMKDLMETNPDNSPVVKPLKEVFYLP